MEFGTQTPAFAERVRVNVIETCIDATDWGSCVSRIITWAVRREHRIVSVCNVHSVVTARSNQSLQTAINESDMATPDGKPVAWLIGRRLGVGQPRISGMELTLELCAHAEKKGIPVSFYGSQVGTLDLMRSALIKKFPKLQIGVMISPPYRDLSADELDADINSLNESGAGLVFIGLGCPKQEVWMHANRHRISAVQIGVGAVFDFLAGTVSRPPVWMQEVGLEWLGRLIAEPRRLWKRYLVTNSLFLLWLVRESLVGSRGSSRDA